MKATGVVRKVDELGRIVIPKEIRKTSRIKEGTPLEIFCGETGEVVFKKYSEIKNLKDYADECCESIVTYLKCKTAIFDKNEVISCGGTNIRICEQILGGNKLEKLLNSNGGYIAIDNEKLYYQPIENLGNKIGGIVIWDYDFNGEKHISALKIISVLLSKLVD